MLSNIYNTPFFHKEKLPIELEGKSVLAVA